MQEPEKRWGVNGRNYKSSPHFYSAIQQCGRELGISATSISSLCRGRGKTRKGYHLKYYDDTINA